MDPIRLVRGVDLVVGQASSLSFLSTIQTSWMGSAVPPKPVKFLGNPQEIIYPSVAKKKM